ncbi:MAG: DUF4294 domain-containing protein [Bacteroidaceae bacterium]|nr:DUF4294 domain-containing protein [Bacteroidaceae bacterium]
MKSTVSNILILLLALLLSMPVKAQGDGRSAYIVGAATHKGETIPHIKLPTVYIFTPLKFKNKRERTRYDRLVYDVKKTLPLATEIRKIIIETYETLQLLPDEKAQNKHLEKLEKELKETYTPKMKKLSLRQGKLLIKLVDRQCDQNAYQLIKLFMGSFKAVFYQSFASLFGASLKKTYDPMGEDSLTERVVIQVLSGEL